MWVRGERESGFCGSPGSRESNADCEDGFDFLKNARTCRLTLGEEEFAPRIHDFAPDPF